MSHRSHRIGFASALLALSSLTFAGPAFAADKDGSGIAVRGTLDARVNHKAAGARAGAARPAALGLAPSFQAGVARDMTIAADRLAATYPRLRARGNPRTGGLAELKNESGALTGAAPGRRGEDVVRDFLGEHGAVYGLTGADLADLVVLGDSPGGRSGLRMLRMEQQIDGRPVFQSETRFLLDREGRLWQSAGDLVPRARAGVVAPAAGWSAPGRAIESLLRLGGEPSPTGLRVVSSSDDGRRFVLAADDEHVAGEIAARQVYFPLAPGLLVPAWSLVVFTNGAADWYAVVDAETDDVLWRKNIRNRASTHDARFRVYVQADGTTPADSPAPLSPTNATPGSNTQPPEIAPSVVSMSVAMAVPALLGASPNGWIDDCPGGGCTDNQTQTLGNNALACLDRVGGAGAGGANQCDTAASSVIDGNGRPTGNPDINGRNRDFLGTAPRDFQTSFLPPPQGGNPESGQTPTGNGNNGTLAVDQFRRGAITQLFYLTNWYHDRMFNLGFDEPSGNFQQLNLQGLGGVANDRVLAEAQDSSGADNANFSTPPDGQSGRMQMYRFIGPTVDRDASLDAEIVFHELTHGTSNRLIANAAGLVWESGRGLGEGWSDFIALSLLNPTNADGPDGAYAAGAYSLYKAFGVTTYTDNYLYGIRRFPYETDNTVNPLTWGDVDDLTNNLSGGIAGDPLGFNVGGANEVHNSGELWALTLWEVRSRIIADPAGANGNVPAGNDTMLQLVVDGMKATSASPSFTDARDALVAADCITNACANERWIWEGFADRGLGYGAFQPFAQTFAPVQSHVGVHESFLLPHLDVKNPAIDVAINDLGNSDGNIDLDEPVELIVTLLNPWRHASRTATGVSAVLSTTSPGIEIVDGAAAWGDIAPQASVAASDAFTIRAHSVDGATCGQSIVLTLTVSSSLGSTTDTFRLRLGEATGTVNDVTYPIAPQAPVAIQDNRPRGSIFQTTISDDFNIEDLDFRIDSIPHTYPGDLVIGLRGPTGLGTSLVTYIGGAVAGGGDGNNVTNMVIDDEAVADILLATNAQAPYTGSWLPVANSPSWPVLGFGPQDSPNLARWDGTSTEGTWTVIVSDQAAADTGSFVGATLFVDRTEYSCEMLPVELLQFEIE